MNELVFFQPFAIRTVHPIGFWHCRCLAKLLCIMLTGSILMTNASQAAENLNSAVIRGSTSYVAPELFDIYKDRLGRPLTNTTAREIAEAVQQKYVEDGFAKPGYRILDFGLQSRIIRISLAEASISRIQISGNAGPYQHKLESIFGGVPGTTALRPDQVRHGVRLARQIPGLTLAVSTVPDAEKSGAFVLNLDTDFKTFDGSVKLSNRGTTEIGRELLLANINGHGLFNADISSGLFAASAADSGKYRSGGFYSRLGIGDNGASAQVQGSHSTVDIMTSGVALEQRRDLYSIRLARILAKGQGETSIWGKFEADTLEVVQDAAPNREDRLRSIELGISKTSRSRSAVSLISFELEQTLSLFGSKQISFSGSGDLQRPDFTILRLHYTRSVQLDESWSLRGDVYAQHAEKVLPSIKRFKVGGNRIGRGFEAAAATGDRGAGAKLDLRRRLADGSGVFGTSTLYSYYDLGAAWKNDLRGRESAASAGLGLSFRGERLSSYLEAAKPLTHADADDNKDLAVFFEVSLQF